MAGILLTAQTPPILLPNPSAKKTLLQVEAPTNQRLLVKEVSISFNGDSTTDRPIVVKVERQNDAGTMTSLTPQRLDPGVAETPQSSVTQNATAEPTAGELLISEFVHPQLGYTWRADLTIPLTVQGAGRLAVAISGLPSGAVDLWGVARMILEE